MNFPPNLDDGELYLPSDIFPDELTPKFGTPDEHTSQLTCMEGLPQRFSSFSILDRTPPQPPPVPFSPYFELRPVYRPQTVSGVGLGAFPAVNFGHSLGDFGNPEFLAGPRQAYQFQKPAPVQVETFVHARGRVLQRQQQQNGGQDRVLPLRVGGSAATGSGGTGVFLPRVFNDDFRKKPSVKYVEQKQLKYVEQKQPLRNGGAGKRVAFQHPLEKVLPQEWTY